MVNTLKNISAYQGEPTGLNDKISGGPLYGKEQVLGILSERGVSGVSTWTRKCTNNVADLGLDADRLVNLIELALTEGRYRDSEWCKGNKPDIWVAADSYECTRMEWNRFAHKELPANYFIKFAVSKTGQLLLIVSCHT